MNQLKLAHHKYALNHFITLLEKVGTGDRYWELQSMLGDVKKLYDEIPKPMSLNPQLQKLQLKPHKSIPHLHLTRIMEPC